MSEDTEMESTVLNTSTPGLTDKHVRFFVFFFFLHQK